MSDTEVTEQSKQKSPPLRRLLRSMLAASAHDQVAHAAKLPKKSTYQSHAMLPVKQKAKLSDEDIALKSVPKSILDEIKINAPLSEATLSKARQRQSLFLRKRRESKRQHIVMTRMMVLVRLLMSMILIAAWVIFAQWDGWQFFPNETTIQFDNARQDSSEGFLNEQELLPLLKPYAGKPIYLIPPNQIAKEIETRFKHVEHAIVRRHIFPAHLDITIIEKPIWATYYHLAPHEQSSISDLLTRLSFTYPSANLSQEQAQRAESRGFRYVTLMHSQEAMSLFQSKNLTSQQKEVLKQYPAIFAQGKDLTLQQRHSLEEVLFVLSAHQKRFEEAGYVLRCVDARQADDVFLVFNGFQARLGRLDYTVARRANRLVQLLDTIHQYQNKLDWVELSWQGQVTFKLR